MEQERSNRFLAGPKIHCTKSTYHPQHDCGRMEFDGDEHAGPKDPSDYKYELTLFGGDFRFAKCIFDFILKMAGKQYPCHAEMAKKCKKKNDEIYREVMVRMSPEWSI